MKKVYNKLDTFTLAIVQSLCEEWKWRFNSSDTQIKNGTLSLIINGRIWEISSTLQVGERVICKNPSPFKLTSIRVKDKLSNEDSFPSAMKVLHKYIGDGDACDAKPVYNIYHKAAKDNAFTRIKGINDLKEAKKTFKSIIKEYKKEDIYAFRLGGNKTACVMLIENYNGILRLMYLRNGYMPKVQIDDELELL